MIEPRISLVSPGALANGCKDDPVVIFIWSAKDISVQPAAAHVNLVKNATLIFGADGSDIGVRINDPHALLFLQRQELFVII